MLDAVGELVADDADADPRPCRYSAISFETHLYSRAMVVMSFACVQQSLRQISKAGAPQQARHLRTWRATTYAELLVTLISPVSLSGLGSYVARVCECV